MRKILLLIATVLLIITLAQSCQKRPSFNDSKTRSRKDVVFYGGFEIYYFSCHFPRRIFVSSYAPFNRAGYVVWAAFQYQRPGISGR